MGVSRFLRNSLFDIIKWVDRIDQLSQKNRKTELNLINIRWFLKEPPKFSKSIKKSIVFRPLEKTTTFLAIKSY